MPSVGYCRWVFYIFRMYHDKADSLVIERDFSTFYSFLRIKLCVLINDSVGYHVKETLS